ncbi:hypothetical protein LTLLF_118205 [Microtus ochrogaster]|uniref:Uncharacterized protein n=1 Tax=Microtus ochrogaster TaxID=79684 RepID=A0A8J6GWT3_MICOH|nr:hypothetical protein LTLLF_118205 [Microtus ochrogaster]
MDGDRDKDSHYGTGLSSQGPDEEKKEGEHEQESQDRKGCVHPWRRLNVDNKEAPDSDINIRLYLEDYSEEDEEEKYEYTQLMEEEEIDNEEKKGGGEEDMTSVGDCL